MVPYILTFTSWNDKDFKSTHFVTVGLLVMLAKLIRTKHTVSTYVLFKRRYTCVLGISFQRFLWWKLLLLSSWLFQEPDSSVSIVSGYRLDDWAWRFNPRQRQEIFPLTSVSRPALGPTQPPVQWVPGFLSQGLKRSRGVTLTTHPHLVPRSWMNRSYTSSPLLPQ
jgi:hypothetical protein